MSITYLPGTKPPDENENEPDRTYTAAEIQSLVDNDSGLSAEERGWVISDEEHMRRVRYVRRRSLVTVEREVEILRMYHRGIARRDIADKLGVTPDTVSTSIKRSMKRTLDHAGAQQARQKMLHEIDAVKQRVMESILPDPDADGTTPPVDLKAVDTLMKLLNREAALTGADAPAKMQIDGKIDHAVAVVQVDKVAAYMDLVDSIVQGGYGSGVIDANARDEEESLALEPVDIRPLDEQAAGHEHARLPFKLVVDE